MSVTSLSLLVSAVAYLRWLSSNPFTRLTSDVIFFVSGAGAFTNLAICIAYVLYPPWPVVASLSTWAAVLAADRVFLKASSVIPFTLAIAPSFISSSGVVSPSAPSTAVNISSWAFSALSASVIDVDVAPNLKSLTSSELFICSVNRLLASCTFAWASALAVRSSSVFSGYLLTSSSVAYIVAMSSSPTITPNLTLPITSWNLDAFLLAIPAAVSLSSLDVSKDCRLVYSDVIALSSISVLIGLAALSATSSAVYCFTSLACSVL